MTKCSQQRDSQPPDRRSEPKMKAVSPPQNRAPPASSDQCEDEPKPEVEEVEDVERVPPEPATQQGAEGKKRLFPTWLLCGCWRREPKQGGKAKKVSPVAGLMSRVFPDAEWRAGNPILTLPHPCHSEVQLAAGQRHSVGAEVKDRQQPDRWVGLCQERSILGRILEQTQDTDRQGPQPASASLPKFHPNPARLTHSPFRQTRTLLPLDSQLFPSFVLFKVLNLFLVLF